MSFYEDSHGTGRPIIIFGASVLGEVALKALDMCGLKPVWFGDNDKSKQEKPFLGYKVAGLGDVYLKYPDAIMVIGAERYYTEIHRLLSSRGYKLIYNDADVIDCIDFSSVSYDKIKEIIWRIAQLGKLSLIKNIPAGALHLKRLNIVVTERCTLKCENCSSLMPFYKNPKDCNMELLLQSIDRILTCVDLVYRMEVLGGETFLNKDLNVIMEKLSQYEKILQIDVITNGTIFPDKNLIKYLRRDNICVVVNDYGPLSKKKDPLLNTLNESGVKNRLNKHWAWADLGGFESRNKDREKLTELFQKCNFNTCMELLNGELHRCPRSSHGMNAGVIPRDNGDYINVADNSLNGAELKEKIRMLINDKEFVMACHYCDGNTNETLILGPANQNSKAE